jgi:uncharacterized cupredoxin-like copper-binding protein
MMSRAQKKLTFPLAILTSGIAALGCGSDSGTTTTAAGTSPPPAQAVKAIAIDMDEYSYNPKDATGKAGSVSISAKNVGQLPHELVLARTNAAPDKLPTLSDGSVDESKLEAQGNAPGEIPETPAGESKKATLELPAGRYVMYCNIPGHYVAGMYGTLTVK